MSRERRAAGRVLLHGLVGVAASVLVHWMRCTAMGIHARQVRDVERRREGAARCHRVAFVQRVQVRLVVAPRVGLVQVGSVGGVLLGHAG